MGVLLTGQDRDDYLTEEVRNDFTVTKQMKEVWLCEMEILDSIIRICDKHSIKWMVSGGTLLGAVRHNGFIPWDDDIDVIMLRQDYDRFIEVAQKELEPYYFLQTALTDPGRWIGYAQVRDSRTSAIDLRYVTDNNRWNQGIFVDIFVMDTVPTDESQKVSIRNKISSWDRIYRNAYTNKRSLKSGAKKLIGKAIISFNGGLKRFYEKRESIYRDIDCQESQTVGAISFLFNENRIQWNRHIFESLEDHDFEFMKVKISKYYDEMLTHQYGDWHVCVKGAGYHEGMDFNTSISYKEYLVQKYGYSPF